MVAVPREKVFTRQPFSQARPHADRAALLTPGYEF
jgi:hypothetical protein